MAKTLAEIAEMMRDIDFAMFSTHSTGGTIASRPMSNNRDVDYDGDNWFFSFEDTRLVSDGTYFLIEEDAVLGGCGGWSRRATLYGGDHSAGRDAALLDPARDAARVRAMYTHPDQVRKGVGRLILEACEAAAAGEGFTRCELAGTMAGEPLYRACGYHEIKRFTAPTSSGVEVPLVRMGKALQSAVPQ